MNRMFTTREKVLMLFLALVVLGMAYFKLILEPINEQISKYNVDAETEQAEIDTNSVLVAKIRSMEQELEEIKATGESKAIPSYNNSRAVMLELNEILAVADSCTLDFGAVESNGYIMERPVSISFEIGGYAAARDIIDQFNASENINQVSDLAIDMDDGYDGNVSVNLKITYFEVDIGSTSAA